MKHVRVSVFLAIALCASALDADVIVPIVGSVHGAQNSLFESDLKLYNPTSAPMSGAIVETERGVSRGPTDASVPYSIPPHQTVAFLNVYATIVPGRDGAGRLTIVPDSTNGVPQNNPVVSTSTYTKLSDGGELGQVPTPFTADQLYSNTTLAGIVQKDGERYNAFVMTGSQGATIQYTARSASNGQTFTTTATYAPNATYQLNGGPIAGLPSNSSLEVAIVAGSARYAGNKVNNLTNQGAWEDYQPVGSLIEHLVAPADTDPAIDNWLEDHDVMRDTRAAPLGRLLVHFPGSFGVPVDSSMFFRQMAAAGFHVIGLRYPNSWEVGTLCANQDGACYQNVRLEILDGTDRSALVTITPANSIVNRLTKLLVYLDQHYPSEGWGAYLSNGQPRWDLITVSGHSQGGGQAAMIAKYQHVARVMLFASPNDASANAGIAPWENNDHVTPASSYYGFNHQRDSWTLRQAIWLSLGMNAFGAPVDVDGASSYGASHQFDTDALPRTGSYDDAHGAVVTDKDTPLDANGNPLYAPVWRAMAGVQ